MGRVVGREYEGSGWVLWDIWAKNEPACQVRTHVADVGGRHVIDELHVKEVEAVTSNLLRSLPLSSMEADLNGRFGQFIRLTNAAGVPPASSARVDEMVADYLTHAERPLSRPDRVAGEGFYQEVAQQYELRAIRSRRPAAILADESGVPVTTVHRWIAEARRRGFLPPARRGTSG